MSNQDIRRTRRPVVVVAKLEDEKHEHKPYRPTQLQDSPSDKRHSVSTVPAIPSATESLVRSFPSKPNLNESESDYSDENTKKHRNYSKFSAENIPLETIELDKKESSPIPTYKHLPTTSLTKQEREEKIAEAETHELDKSSNEDSIEPAPEVEASPVTSARSAGKTPGRMTRSQSHASIVSRAVRRFVCCGMKYRAPSEEDLSVQGDYFPAI